MIKEDDEKNDFLFLRKKFNEITERHAKLSTPHTRAH